MAGGARGTRRAPGARAEEDPEEVRKKSGGGSEEDAGQVQSIAKGEKLKEEMGEILDEIDSVLEENAEEFVNSYVQKGGE